jgi:hypothetical protein
MHGFVCERLPAMHGFARLACVGRRAWVARRARCRLPRTVSRAVRRSVGDSVRGVTISARCPRPLRHIAPGPDIAPDAEVRRAVRCAGPRDVCAKMFPDAVRAHPGLGPTGFAAGRCRRDDIAGAARHATTSWTAIRSSSRPRGDSATGPAALAAAEGGASARSGRQFGRPSALPASGWRIGRRLIYSVCARARLRQRCRWTVDRATAPCRVGCDSTGAHRVVGRSEPEVAGGKPTATLILGWCEGVLRYAVAGRSSTRAGTLRAMSRVEVAESAITGAWMGRCG